MNASSNGSTPSRVGEERRRAPSSPSDELAGAEAPRVDEQQPRARRRSVEHDARVRHLAGRVEQQRARSCAGASAGGSRPSSAQSRYLPRRPSAATRRPSSAVRAAPPARAARTSADRGSRSRVDRRARARAGASWRRIVSTSGSSGIADERAAREAARSSPVSQSSTDAPTSASGPSWRRPPSPAKRASSGACSRVWSVCGDAGSQPWSAVTISRSSSPRRSSQPRERRVDPPQRGVEALDVLAVTVELVGLDQVREHERRARGSPISALDARDRLRRWSAPGCVSLKPAPAKSAGALPTPWTATPGGEQRVEVSSATAARARSRDGPSVRSNAPGAPSNGRAITRPTASRPRARAAAPRTRRRARPAPSPRRARRAARPSPARCRGSGGRCARCSSP